MPTLTMNYCRCQNWAWAASDAQEWPVLWKLINAKELTNWHHPRCNGFFLNSIRRTKTNGRP